MAEGTLPLFLWLYLPRLVSVEAPQKQWCVHRPFYSSNHGQGISFIKHCAAQRMTVENKVGKACGVEQMESSLMVSLGLKGISNKHVPLHYFAFKV